jgi:hypothetical protein
MLDSVQLFFGVIVSFFEMRKRGVLSFEDFDFSNNYSPTPTEQEFNEESNEYFSDWWPEWKFSHWGVNMNNLKFQYVPHDVSEEFDNYDFHDAYFIVGVTLPDECDLEDMVTATNKFKDELTNSNHSKYLKYFSELKPKFYMMPNDCTCCS